MLQGLPNICSVFLPMCIWYSSAWHGSFEYADSYEGIVFPLLSVVLFSVMYRKFSFLNISRWKQFLFVLSKGKLRGVLNLMWRNFIRVGMLFQLGSWAHAGAHHTPAHLPPTEQKSSIFKLQCLAWNILLKMQPPKIFWPLLKSHRCKGHLVWGSVAFIIIYL